MCEHESAAELNDKWKVCKWQQLNKLLLTRLVVEHDLILKLLALLQGFIDAEDDAFAGLRPVQELTGTALLHDLGPGEACELAEAIGAVNDGKALWHLCVGEDEVAVCRRKWRKRRGERRTEGEVMTLFSYQPINNLRSQILQMSGKTKYEN